MSIVAELIASQESPIMGAKYIGAVALSCLVYDHLLHFNDELADVWLNFRQKPILKSLFVLGRYCAMIAVVYTARSLGIFNTEMTTEFRMFAVLATLIVLNSCQVWVVVTVIFIGLALIGTEGIVIYRLRSLWQFNRPITHAIVIMVLFVFISTIVTMSLEAAQLQRLMHAVPGVPGCLFISPSSRPFASSMILAGVLVIWDIFNICIFTFNTFATPYLRSSDVSNRFKRDGGRYFLYLLFMHLLLLFFSAFGQNSRISAVPLIMSLTTIINARIFHGIGLEAERYADQYNVTLSGVAVADQSQDEDIKYSQRLSEATC